MCVFVWNLNIIIKILRKYITKQKKVDQNKHVFFSFVYFMFVSQPQSTLKCTLNILLRKNNQVGNRTLIFSQPGKVSDILSLAIWRTGLGKKSWTLSTGDNWGDKEKVSASWLKTLNCKKLLCSRLSNLTLTVLTSIEFLLTVSPPESLINVTRIRKWLPTEATLDY